MLIPTMDGTPGSLRAERYRQFAAETLRLARAAETAEIKATYVSLAACWKKLAENADSTEPDEHRYDGEDASAIGTIDGH